MRSVLALVRDIEALVLPVACLGCKRPVRERLLCDQCRASVRPLAPPRCGRCGQTLDRWEKLDGRRELGDGGQASVLASPISHLPSHCGFCRTWPEALAWADSAVQFDDVARELVHALKYGGWHRAAEPMADLMARHLGARLRGIDLLVPVPLGRHRQRARGYNQAEMLARALSGRAGIAVDARLLSRSRETRTQTALDPAERRSNVAGAFVARGRLAGRKVVVVDDVLTTGATLAAAAEALSAGGAAEVGALTFARAAKPH